MTTLRIQNIKKSYKNKNVVQDISLEISSGEIIGLLGPNGAGKTTFINILAGTVIKTEGQVSVCGFDLDKDPRQVRASVGIVPQEINLDPFLVQKNFLNCRLVFME